MISSAHSLESNVDGFHNTLILTLAESLAAVGKIEEALDEASQAGTVVNPPIQSGVAKPRDLKPKPRNLFLCLTQSRA